MMNSANANLILKGMAMGIAEIIPGVSGGTIAFITGIYKTLLDSIKAFDVVTLRLLLSGKFTKAWDRVNGSFLLFVFAGMGIGIISGVFGITHLLDNYPTVLWAFFFGLILASVPMMMHQISNYSIWIVVSFIIGTVIAYFITSQNPAEGSDSLFYVFLSGMLAIVALVLPGISGSFILLLLGSYTLIIPTLKSFLSGPSIGSLTILATFSVGCIVGLTLFVRIVTKAFEERKDLTISLMSGFMLGSLNKIWPWRNPSSILEKDSGQITGITGEIAKQFDLTDDRFKILSEQNVLPENYMNDPMVFPVFICFVLGVFLIVFMNKMSQPKQNYLN